MKTSHSTQEARMEQTLEQSITASLQRRMNPEDLLDEQWLRFKDKMQEGDEIWTFRTPQKPWADFFPRCIMEGFALVRDDIVVAKILTAESCGPAKSTGVLWVEEVGFLCDQHCHDMDLPDFGKATREHADEELLATGALPDLGGAPVASWLLARVARLAGKRFPYSYGEVVGSDGADYWLHFYCLSRTGNPLGVLSCFANQLAVVLTVNHSPQVDPNVLLNSFIRLLLAEPDKVSRCRIIVQYTEMTDPKVACHIPRVYGWDGRRYLNEGAPEHAVDPGEYR